MIIAYVGSGGKTTTIKRRTKELLEDGFSVLVVTSTHMQKEENTIITHHIQDIQDALKESPYVMAGSDCKDKMGPLPYSVYKEACNLFDFVLIEADGSKRLPIKYPNDTEPVIYENVDEVVIVTGLNALHQPFKDVCHRFELCKDILHVHKDDEVKAEHIQTLLRKGYIEKMNDMEYKIEPTHIDSLYKRVISVLLKENIDVTLVDETWFALKPTLIVCGAGHVSLKLVELAIHLDLHIKVIDDREEFASPSRFPPNVEVIYDSFDHLDNHLVDHGYYVVVTRGHKDDYECVKKILNTSYSYLGMIGSKKKVIKTKSTLLEDGFSKDCIESIHAPIGLDIHAQTPSEIGISILAEIIQVKNQINASSISNELLQTDKKGTLCIVIDKQGSAPRGKGSMMLVGDDFVLDTIGGGEVEALAIEDAKKVHGVFIKEYVLDNERSRELGMICGGTQTILFVSLN